MIDILNLAQQARLCGDPKDLIPLDVEQITGFANLYREALLAELFEGNSDLLADKHDRSVAFAILRERERCAKVCEELAMKNELACDSAESKESMSLRSAAWQMSVCATTIRKG